MPRLPDPLEHHAPAHGPGVTEPQKGKGRFDDNGGRDPEGHVEKGQGQDVGHYVPEHYPEMRGPRHFGRLDERPLLEGEGLGPDHP